MIRIAVFDKHVSTVTNIHGTMEELLDVVFSVRFVSCKKYLLKVKWVIRSSQNLLFYTSFRLSSGFKGL